MVACLRPFRDARHFAIPSVMSRKRCNGPNPSGPLSGPGPGSESKFAPFVLTANAGVWPIPNHHPGSEAKRSRN